MNDLAPKILGNIDASDAAPALQQILKAIDSTTILAITDARGQILHVNDRFCEISKYDREELVGQNHRILKSNHHDRNFFIDMWRTIGAGQTWNGEIKNRAKDGSYYWVETSIVPFLDDQGRPFRYAAIRKDITDKKTLSEQIELERARLVTSEKMAALGEMAAGIAHEVGNPLGAMRGRVEMLQMKASEGEISADDVLKSSEVILRLIDRTSKIVRGLKAYSRDASNDSMEEVDVYQLVTDILDFSMSRIEKSQIHLNKEFSSQALRALCRESEIGQVLVNLINNACDVLKGRSHRQITVRVYPRSSDAVIEIEDSGPGIAPDQSQQIFEPFFTTKPAGSGTGLGLSISRKIMDSHGGDLRLVESAGTCFQVCWPLSS